jgi:hypothetical protein
MTPRELRYADRIRREREREMAEGQNNNQQNVEQNDEQDAGNVNVDWANLMREMMRNAAAQQAVIAGLVDRVAPREPPVTEAILDSIGRFYGRPEEDFDAWEAGVLRAAQTEGWREDRTRNIAIGRLGGAASEWQEQAGKRIQGWDDWRLALRLAFQRRLTLSEWCTMVDARRQRPNEAGSRYALEMARLCRLCPYPLDDNEVVRHLIRGLHRPELAAVLMSNPPINVQNFISRIAELEGVHLGRGISKQRLFS